MVSADTEARRRLRRTVVCLDDDLQVLSSIRRLLRTEPFDLLTTDRPETVLDWVDRGNVDLLITDLRMPGMNGAEILKEVEERSPGTKSLILTGYPSTAPPETPMVAKPWDDADLKKKIRDLTQATRPLPYVLLQAPEPKVRLALVGIELDLEELAPGWFEPAGEGEAQLALIDAQHAEVEVARRMKRAYKILLTDQVGREHLDPWYEAGVDQALRKPLPDYRVVDVLRRCAPLARLRRKEEPQPKRPWFMRLLLGLWKAWTGNAGPSLFGLALLLGIFFAVGLNAMSAALPATPSPDAFMDRFLRFTAQDMMLRRWSAMQQLELGREMNEQTRRYYQEQLQNQRWQGIRPRPELSESRVERTVVVPLQVQAPPAQASSPVYPEGTYRGNGLPYR